VHVYDAEAYKGMSLFLTADGKSGFALKGNDIVSCFKHPASTAEGFADEALGLATQLGGRTLDAFDTVLPQLYSKSGFRAVARIPWNDEHKPDGWNYDAYKKFKDGRPDVVFMIYDPANAKRYKPGDGRTYGSYDDASRAQHRALDDVAVNTAVTSTKERWYSASPFKGNLAGAMAAAPVAQAQLGPVGEAIAKKYGVVFKNPGVKKDVARIQQKVADRGGVERVTDLARATFLIRTPEQAEAIATELGKHFEVAVEPWRITDVNYADRAIQVRFKGGLIGEVLVMDADMAHAKSPDGGGGHDLYVEQRKLDPVKDAKRWQELHKQQQALYGHVLDNYSRPWKAALGIEGS